jgi:hypothetical protein
MRLYLSLIVGLAGCHAASRPAATALRDPRVIETAEGRVIGKADVNDVTAFLGGCARPQYPCPQEPAWTD